MIIPETLFPELTWKDDPAEVKLALVKPAGSNVEKSCENCRFMGGYPKCYKSDNEPCSDWAIHNGKTCKKK